MRVATVKTSVTLKCIAHKWGSFFRRRACSFVCYDIHIRLLCCVACFAVVCFCCAPLFRVLSCVCVFYIWFVVGLLFVCFALFVWDCVSPFVYTIYLHDWSPAMRCRWSYERSYDFYSVSIGYYLPIHAVVLSRVTIFFLLLIRIRHYRVAASFYCYLCRCLI